MIVKEFDGGYGRVGTIEKTEGKCTICGETKDVIEIDASEGEYSSGSICEKCCAKIFAHK